MYVIILVKKGHKTFKIRSVVYMRMSVNAGSQLAKEWAREEIEKLNRLDMAELEMWEREERKKNEADKT